MAVAALLPALPAATVVTAPGIQGFQLTGTVGYFPCVVPTCAGTLSGVGAASVTGTSTSGSPFSGVWPDPTLPPPASNTTGTMSNILDVCLVSLPVPSLTGSGQGTFSLTGGLLVYQGQESHSATLSGSFSEVRGVAGMVVTVSGATVTNSAGLVIAYQANLVSGAGGGSYTTTSGVGLCNAPLVQPTVQITAGYLAPE